MYRPESVFKNHRHPIALYDSRIHLRLDFEHMETYVGWRYLETLKKEEVIALFEELQAKDGEVFIEINADGMQHSSSTAGFGVSRISGSPILVAKWKSMFTKSIAERYKDRGIDYGAVIKATEPPKPEPPKITHRNLHQMESLVKQGADPNAPYWLAFGLP